MYPNQLSDTPSVRLAKRAVSIFAALVIAPAIALPLALVAILCLPLALFGLPWIARS